ncbi:hypothetical protein K469DRAFT_566462, partial [Zopfia rhizophila CBS 207.26]
KCSKETIRGVTNGDLRRMARRGGVKRMGATIYDDMRSCLKRRLELVNVVSLVEHCGKRTVCTSDVVWVLNKLANPCTSANQYIVLMQILTHIGFRSDGL